MLLKKGKGSWRRSVTNVTLGSSFALLLDSYVQSASFKLNALVINGSMHIRVRVTGHVLSAVTWDPLTFKKHVKILLFVVREVEDKY